MVDIYKRADNESFDDYFVRLFEHKKEYGLDCVAIAELLNYEKGVSYGESAWRKEYAAFNRGRIYEKQKKFSDVKERILCLSDLHIPFQKSIDTFKDYRGRVDTLVLAGDITDCQAISKFPKSYRVSPMEEIIETRAYIIDLIEYIQPLKVIVFYGNHDIRFQNYLSKNLDTDLLELMPKTSLELIINDGFHHYNKRERTKTWYAPLTDVLSVEVDIEYIDNWYYQHGQTIFCHPLSYMSGILKTAEKAVNYFRNEGHNFKTLVMAHTHQVGDYKRGGTIFYEQGCCCDTKKQHYTDGRLTNSQKEGFIYICHDKNDTEIPSLTTLEHLN